MSDFPRTIGVSIAEMMTISFTENPAVIRWLIIAGPDNCAVRIDVETPSNLDQIFIQCEKLDAALKCLDDVDTMNECDITSFAIEFYLEFSQSLSIRRVMTKEAPTGFIEILFQSPSSRQTFREAITESDLSTLKKFFTKARNLQQFAKRAESMGFRNPLG